MAKQFTCPHCHHSYRFLNAMAGQSMHCQSCGFVFRIPLVPLARAEGVEFPKGGKWLLRLAGGRQFGPVRREMIYEWLREGRADADSLIALEGNSAWYRVTEAFPKAVHFLKGAALSSGSAPMAEAASAPVARPIPEPIAASQIPASGLMELLEDCSQEPPRGRLRPILRQHSEALLSLEAECSRAAGLIRSRGACLVWLEEDNHRRHAQRSSDGLNVEAATVAAFTGPQGGEFYSIIPWSRLGRLPHEFLSILPGRLPGPVALRRASDEAFDGGHWIGSTGDDRDITAHAASISREKMVQDIVWDWHSDNRLYHMIQVWGLQGIPLGPEKFAHLIQTAGRPDPDQPHGLRWYLERQSAFWRFARRLNLPASPGSPVLFSACGARLLVLAAARLQESPVA